MKYILIIILFALAGINTCFLLTTPYYEVRIKELVPSLPDLQSIPQFDELIGNLLDSYGAHAFIFNFPDFDKVDQCVLYQVNEDNLRTIFRKVHKPYGAVEFIPKSGMICVRMIELEMDVEIFISHNNGVVIFAYSK